MSRKRSTNPWTKRDPAREARQSKWWREHPAILSRHDPATTLASSYTTAQVVKAMRAIPHPNKAIDRAIEIMGKVGENPDKICYWVIERAEDAWSKWYDETMAAIGKQPSTMLLYSTPYGPSPLIAARRALEMQKTLKKANFEMTGLSEKDMEFIKERRIHRDKICQALGVPTCLIDSREDLLRRAFGIPAGQTERANHHQFLFGGLVDDHPNCRCTPILTEESIMAKTDFDMSYHPIIYPENQVIVKTRNGYIVKGQTNMPERDYRVFTTFAGVAKYLKEHFEPRKTKPRKKAKARKR